MAKVSSTSRYFTFILDKKISIYVFEARFFVFSINFEYTVKLSKDTFLKYPDGI